MQSFFIVIRHTWGGPMADTILTEMLYRDDGSPSGNVVPLVKLASKRPGLDTITDGYTDPPKDLL